MISLYYETGSPVHKIPAGVKLLTLVFLGSLLFAIENIWLIGSALIGILCLYGLARIPIRVIAAQMKPAMFLLGIIFIAQFFLVGWEVGLLVVIRFAVLILGASLVTLTTLTTHMIAAIEAVLKPFSSWISVEKISLALSLAIRFIPVVAALTAEVREAQRVRGLERNLLAVALPVIIRTLKMGDQIAEALDARSFGTGGVNGKTDA